MIIAIALAMLAPSELPDEAGKPWFLEERWLEYNAPNGIDMTIDGKPWISMNFSSQGDYYSMLADDYQVRNAKYPLVWIRGIHKGNKKVPYRETKFRMSFDCANSTTTTRYWIAYRADMSVYQSLDYKYPQSEPIVPGSIAETWKSYACRPPQ